MMQHRRRVALCAMVLCVFCVVRAHAQTIDEMEFRNQPITDVLLALGRGGEVSIIADETVTGTASYYFADTTFRRAFDQFLSAYNLHYRFENGVYYVSRVGIEYDSGADVVSVAVDSMDMTTVVRAVSRRIGKTILYDPLPHEPVTLSVDSLAPARLLSIMVRRFPEYVVESEAEYLYIRRVPLDESTGAGPEEAQPELVRSDGERYSVTIESARFRDVLDRLFHLAEREYSLFVQGDAVLRDLRFADREFESALRLILDHGNADFELSDGIYHIFDIQRRDVLRRYVSTVMLPLRYLSVQELPSLLPPELSANNLFRLDQGTNTVILAGSDEQIAPLREFIEKIDVPNGNRANRRFDLKYLPVADAISALPARFSSYRPTAVPHCNAFVVAVSDEMAEELRQFVELIDVGRQGHPVTLRYVKAADLLDNLPPSVSKDQIVATGMPEVVFFRGSRAALDAFLRELEVIDRPRPQIRYELLVVQYQQSDALEAEISASNELYSGETEQSFLGTIGGLLDLDFDIISTFGYQFAVNLSTKLTDSTARVLADTTLNGLSGEQLSFQNTSTFRYRDREKDPDTGELEPTGVVREITSGLILKINGWSSGDGMITMDVSATVSKQGSADLSGSGNLPPTSERVVTTHVRAETGRPVIISGLVQQETSVINSKVPILGDIPLLGRLFRTSTDSVENTELAVYIVPHVERFVDEEVNVSRAFELMYRRHRETQ